MSDKNKNPLKKVRFYFLAAAILIGVPNIFGFYGGQTGRLLVATQRTENDPNFSRSVVYIFYNGIWGAQGVVINEPLPIDVSDTALSEEEKDAYNLFKGGPVAFPGYKTVALDVPSKASRWRTQPLTVVEYASYKSYLDQNKPDDEQNNEVEKKPLYFGYSGWVTGQLESELRRGIWRVLECNSLDFNGIQSSGLWELLSGDLKTTSCASKN